MKVTKYSNQNMNTSNISFGILPKKYKVVDNYLIRGPHPNIKDIINLKKEGINKIYDFRHYGIKGFKWIERIACNLVGIEYKRKPYSFLQGKFPTKEEYETIAKEVKINGENGGKTLFHCNSGTHRTSLMTAFYEITKGSPLDDCKKDTFNFGKLVDDTVKKHILDFRYFERNRVRLTRGTLPIINAKNKFNTKVTNGINRAFNLFMDMMKT